MDGKLFEKEKVENKDRKFGAALEYFPVKFVTTSNENINALFTKHEIDQAIDRAKRNPEDIEKDSKWWNLFD